MLTRPAAPIEKIYHVVQMIEHQRALSSKDAGIIFSITDAIQRPLESGDLRAILNKLEQDEGVIILNEVPDRSLRWVFRLTSKFDDYSQRVKAQYEEWQKSKPQEKPVSLLSFASKPFVTPKMYKDTQSEKDQAFFPKKEVHVSIRFDDMNRYILLNDSFLIAQPDYDSENYRFFEYVWKNPNRTITLDELNKKLESPLKKPLAKILENLNFRGQLKDTFFQVSKTSIRFIPNRSIDDLIEARLYPLRLFTTQKAD